METQQYVILDHLPILWPQEKKYLDEQIVKKKVIVFASKIKKTPKPLPPKAKVNYSPLKRG